MLRPALNLRIRVMLGEHIAIGPGKVALLEALRDTHSISAAARSLGMSYRRAWLLVDEMNAALRSPAVISASGGQHGGGSELTEVGLEIIRLYRRVEDQALAANRDDIKQLLHLLRVSAA